MKKPISHFLVTLLFSTVAAQSQILTTLVNFNDTNGDYPMAVLIQASDGNFYGTTTDGGNISLGDSLGYGTVFKMTPDGSTLTTLVNFNGTNGAYPYAGLIQGSDGNFYGTTLEGGTNHEGTVFKMTTNGTLITLVDFNGTNGAYPSGNLVQGRDGNFYGTTSVNSGTDYGTVFKMTPDGILTTLISFNYTNGATGYSVGLLQGSDGNFYGVTPTGGKYDDGTAFKVTTNGTLTTLINFNGTNGADPYASLVQGSDGDFYGTTSLGNGTIFKMTPDGGTLTTLVNFNGTNGAIPYGLVQGSDGNFYGVTYQGGTNDWGTVFKMTSDGTLTTLVNFNVTNGVNPQAGLMQGSDGNLYGTTTQDGSGAGGTIFKITGLNLLPEFQSITLSNGNVNLAWNSVSNWTYRVQYKTNLTDAYWTDLPGDVLATNVISGKSDPMTPTQRFYHLVLLP
jgi:uncharacterized repeat protein (TIGR03803 family)